jgi:hypothetical protein
MARAVMTVLYERIIMVMISKPLSWYYMDRYGRHCDILQAVMMAYSKPLPLLHDNIALVVITMIYEPLR